MDWGNFLSEVGLLTLAIIAVNSVNTMMIDGFSWMGLAVTIVGIAFVLIILFIRNMDFSEDSQKAGEKK